MVLVLVSLLTPLASIGFLSGGALDQGSSVREIFAALQQLPFVVTAHEPESREHLQIVTVFDKVLSLSDDEVIELSKLYIGIRLSKVGDPFRFRLYSLYRYLFK